MWPTPYLSPLLYNRNVCISVACVSESLSTLLVLHVLFLWINTLPSHWIKFLSLLVHEYCVFPWLNNTEQFFINLNPCGGSGIFSFLFCNLLILTLAKKNNLIWLQNNAHLYYLTLCFWSHFDDGESLLLLMLNLCDFFLTQM